MKNPQEYFHERIPWFGYDILFFENLRVLLSGKEVQGRGEMARGGGSGRFSRAVRGRLRRGGRVGCEGKARGRGRAKGEEGRGDAREAMTEKRKGSFLLSKNASSEWATFEQQTMYQAIKPRE